MQPFASARIGRWSPIAVLASYLAFFTWALWRWIVVARFAEPSGHRSNIEDHWLVAWIIGWVGHIVTVAPQQLFDVPINQPAPAQLAAIEHFLSTSLLVAPVLAATGSAVLAANIAAIVSYPLAAFAMNRLLVEIGASALVAWIGGALFAMGPECVPANVLVLKYPNVYLPLVALCLTRLRRRPDVRRATWLAVSLVLALLSSYYLAVLVLFAGGLWGACELARRDPGRMRYALLAVAATVAALAVLALVSIPYFARPEAQASGPPVSSVVRRVVEQLISIHRMELVGSAQLTVAAVGLLLLFWRRPAGELARRGALIAVLSGAMMLGPTHVVYGYEVPMPFALLQATPAVFFRYPFRFSVVWGFGVTLLFSGALEGARRLFGVAGTVAAVAAALFAMGNLVPRLSGHGLAEFWPVRQPVYAAVRDAIRADGGDGPLLELPHDLPRTVEGRGYVPSVELQSMLGWTIHQQPLVVGYVDFPPPHRRWVDSTIGRLPAGNAVDALVSMTHLKWLLLHPREEWRVPRTRDKLMSLAGVTRVLSSDGWDLLRVDRPIRHPEWYDAVRGGNQPGQTVLGTPIRKLAPAEAKSAVWGSLPERMHAGEFSGQRVSVMNRGSATWPIAAKETKGLVRYQIRWWRLGVPPTPRNALRTRRYPLPYDLAPGDREDFHVWLVAPRSPGAYLVEIKIVQGADNPFDSPGNVALRGVITVRARPATAPKERRRAVTAPNADDGASSRKE